MPNCREMKINEGYFDNMLRYAHMWVWKNKGVPFMIENNKFVIDTVEKMCLLEAIVSRKWFLNNIILKLNGCEAQFKQP